MFEWLDPDKFLTVELGRSLITALFGAALGAWAAQSLAAKIREREERLKAVRAANAAVMLAYTITDSMLGFKHQLVKPTVDQYLADRRRVIADREASERRPPGSYPAAVIIEVNTDMQAFSPLLTPVRELQEIVFKQISPPMRPFWVMGILSATLVTLEQVVTQRNQLIETFRKTSSEGKDITNDFFGLKTPKGADERYAHIVEHLRDKTDDAIFFSKILGDDLLRYTTALRRTLPDAVKPFSPVITGVNFSRRADIMPASAKYTDYDQMYQEVRALGTEIWSGKFEALAFAQYRTESIFYVM